MAVTGMAGPGPSRRGLGLLAWIAPAAACASLAALGGCGRPAVRNPGGVPPRPRAADAPPRAKAVIRTAKSYLPEEEGGRPKPLDCSDFVRRVFAENGVRLPRTAAEQSLAGERVASSRDLWMGDLVFFSGSRVNRIVGHVGIYVANGIFIHFPNGADGVAMESLYSDHYRKRYLAARRLIP